jgi:hypothetical protein
MDLITLPYYILKAIQTHLVFHDNAELNKSGYKCSQQKGRQGKRAEIDKLQKIDDKFIWTSRH